MSVSTCVVAAKRHVQRTTCLALQRWVEMLNQLSIHGTSRRSIAAGMFLVHTVIVLIVGAWCLVSSGEMRWARSVWLMLLDFPLIPVYGLFWDLLSDATLATICLSATLGGALYAGLGWLIGVAMEYLRRDKPNA